MGQESGRFRREEPRVNAGEIGSVVLMILIVHNRRHSTDRVPFLLRQPLLRTGLLILFFLRQSLPIPDRVADFLNGRPLVHLLPRLRLGVQLDEPTALLLDLFQNVRDDHRLLDPEFGVLVTLQVGGDDVAEFAVALVGPHFGAAAEQDIVLGRCFDGGR